MNVMVMLCDKATKQEGKLNILGGGWSIINPGVREYSLALRFEAEQHEDGHHDLRLVLSDADGWPYRPPGSSQGVAIDGVMDIKADPGAPDGMVMVHVESIDIVPMPLPPATVFTWRVWIDGVTQEHWAASFVTRAEPLERAA
jgi:hypothetical protein